MVAPKQRPTFEEAVEKAERYCAYQERSHSEVRNKLREMGLPSAEMDDVLLHLVKRNFLNEERFARAFAGGKFRTKHWGRKKIIYQLKAKGINDKLIQQVLEEIDPGDYEDTLQNEIKKKDRTMKTDNTVERMAKMTKFLIAKGFEHEIVVHTIKKFYKK